MSGYILYLFLGVLGVVLWRALAGRALDQLLDAGDNLHHQVLATNKANPKGGDWADHRRWMAEQE